MTPSDLTSPFCSATATAIVSAWTSKPTNFTLFIDRLLSLVALYCRSSDSQHNPRLRIGAGYSIVTRYFNQHKFQTSKDQSVGGDVAALRSLFMDCCQSVYFGWHHRFLGGSFSLFPLVLHDPLRAEPLPYRLALRGDVRFRLCSGLRAEGFALRGFRLKEFALAVSVDATSYERH